MMTKDQVIAKIAQTLDKDINGKASTRETFYAVKSYAGWCNDQEANWLDDALLSEWIEDSAP